MKRFKEEVRRGAEVTATMWTPGFGSSSHLYERARLRLEMTPATYRKEGLDMDIVYDVFFTPVGWALIASTRKGLCGVRLGASATALVAGLRAEYRHTRVRRDARLLRIARERVRGLLDGTVRDARLPIDVKATAFQARVWAALRAIPRGETRSYAEIARAIGRPRAVRAVARACASNPVALVVPCHRVIASDGGLAGYRWGVDRKRALLDRERRP